MHKNKRSPNEAKLLVQNFNLKTDNLMQQMVIEQQRINAENDSVALQKLQTANIYLQNRDYIQAINLFNELSLCHKSEPVQQLIANSLNNCKTQISDKAMSLIGEAKKLLTENNPEPDKIEPIKSILKKARELLSSIGESTNADLIHLETGVNWHENRAKINANCNTLLQNIPDQAHSNENFIRQLNFCVSEYTRHIDFMNPTEKELYSSVATLLTASQNIIIQQNIHNDLLPRVITFLVAGDLLSAYDCLKTCKQEATKITRADDVAKYRYTSPNYFDVSLNILSQEAEAFKTRRNAQVAKITAETINKAVKRRCDEFGTGTKFYDQEKKAIYKTISIILADHWHKFDEQGLPKELAESIDEIIFNGLKQTSMIGRYYYWTDADVWFADIKRVQSRITDLINEYSATINADPLAINLPILPGLAEHCNNKLRDTIKTLLLPKANICIEQHKWQDAYDALELCKKTAQKITNTGDLSQPNYPSPEGFEQQQNDLLPKIQDFNQRLQTEVKKNATIIINKAVQSKCKDLCLGSKLYPLEARRLNAKLNSVLAQNWHKFNDIGFPEELAESIHKIIYDDLKMARVMPKFYYWTDADVWFADIGGVEAQIELAITKYMPLQEASIIEAIPVAPLCKF